MKLVVVKKGTRKWVRAAQPTPAGCCLTIEAAYWPCFEIGLNG